ncbi:hypothetical protein ACQB6R_04960 [Propionibacteriaceae bacterium G1746]|uniref:hypothetical protein n=1 Tax=Aestuariimicrobium sp. G57 TaxID=3418485 RepID=UPI003C2963F5
MTRATAPRWQQALNLALVVVGVLVIAYAGLVMGRGAVTCRGVEMAPGDVCHKSSYTQLQTAQTQTYEQRLEATRSQRPIVAIGGVLVAGFGLFLFRRGGTSRGAVSSDEQRLLEHH